MASAQAALTIRKLEENVKSRLRVQAAENGRSMEEEAREILRNALNKPAAPHFDLAASIRRRVASIGGVELPPREREAMRQPPDLGK